LLSALVVWIFWPFVIGAGWVPTPTKAVLKMIDMAEVKPSDTVYDLGSGDGRIIIAAAKERGCRAVGIEADPLRLLLTRLRIKAGGLEGRVEVLWGNFFKKDLGGATVVTIYQTQDTNNRLREKLRRELGPGSRVVSYVFTFEDWQPAKVDDRSEVYLYVI